MTKPEATTPDAGGSPLDVGVRPRAWLREPKVQRHPGRNLVRGVTITQPTPEEREFAELDGDALVPLYDQSALDAALAAARERGHNAGFVEASRLHGAEIERLRAALADAIESVESWSAYAPPYFSAKHNLAEDLERLRAYLRPNEK